jgi:hypothetical protein
MATLRIFLLLEMGFTFLLMAAYSSKSVPIDRKIWCARRTSAETLALLSFSSFEAAWKVALNLAGDKHLCRYRQKCGQN